jgi:hypothetical protein
MPSDLIKLPHKFDTKELLDLYNDCEVKAQQLYVTSVDGNTYTYDAQMIKKHDVMGFGDNESLFCNVNKYFKGSYVEEVFNTVNAAYGVCRTRFMLLDTSRRAYSYHVDRSARLHIPLATNKDCIFIVETGTFQNEVHYMPNEGQLYCLETRKRHSAINLGNMPRLHLVFSLIDPNIGPNNIMRKV